MLMRLIALVVSFGLVVWVEAIPAAAQQPARIGFVVGNAEYGRSPLPTALNDAGLVSKALRSVGFDLVEEANLSQSNFLLSFRKFLTKAAASGQNAVVFVYLSGYGFAFENDNYLVAVNGKLNRVTDVPFDTIRLSDVIYAVKRLPARTKVVAVDAARRLPFPLATAVAPGLVPVEAPENILIGFSTSPGLVVTDAVQSHGPYATAVAEVVGTAGLNIASAFTRVRARTLELTEGRQMPWHVSTLSEAAVLASAEPATVTPGTITGTMARSAGGPPAPDSPPTEPRPGIAGVVAAPTDRMSSIGSNIGSNGSLSPASVKTTPDRTPKRAIPPSSNSVVGTTSSAGLPPLPPPQGFD